VSAATLRRCWALALLAVLVIAATLQAEAAVVEPPGLWTGPMVGETPATLQGATVIDVPTLERMLEGPVLLIDVGKAARRPDNLPEDTLWKPVHRSIPGAAWFPGGGAGDLPPDQAQALLERIDELAKGDEAAVLVTFCKPNCWGSWNLGKRLVEAGYRKVHWLPAGIDGWQEQHDTAPVQPQPGWPPEGE
jgi:PQQ-dependent catabolism-associated CXXCW motif protein